ncbi:hypothetical protein PSI15_17045 [Xenorhabdus sp. PR6a]|uniref:hypothetical protein n=1 Tax=Xenorhabdus sp. PR6a TaxID=3025877 RepID=UPI0023590E73|nr:hypothetical protein [Xenorhabdus sp. PR6a]MDC9583228.1 hypothetical protein [Xenorhabdus sp. PR6a]
MSRFLSDRIFVSETDLPNEIIRNWSDVKIEIDSNNFQEDEFKNFLYALKNKVKKESNIFVKNIKGNLEGLINGIMYSNLDDHKWLQAACITEIFRHPDISKNSGYIDTFIFQNKIYSYLDKEELKFVLGWGQAKRSCGGLKTEGYSADLSELYAIMMLQLIANSVHIISGKKVNILVVTGGNRFHDALFTDEEKIKRYDSQRTIIANFFSDNEAFITFMPYENELIKKNMLMPNIRKIDDQNINKFFKTILVNIDWDNILSNYHLCYHGIIMPSNLQEYLKNGGDKKIIITMAVVSILRNDTHNYWINKVDSIELFDDTIDYFREITIQSTIKYLSIHLIGDVESILQNEFYSNCIRLTVHMKHDRHDIPAIYTLGKIGGNKLSQHVCMSVIDGVINFSTVLELYKNEKIKKYFPPIDGGELFHWLNTENQPLLYSNDNVSHTFSNILSIPLIKI